MKCLKCGTEQAKESKFCDSCGTPLVEKDIKNESLTSEEKVITIVSPSTNHSGVEAEIGLYKSTGSKFKLVFLIAVVAIAIDLIFALGIVIWANQQYGQEKDMSVYIENFVEENKEDYIKEYRPEVQEYIDMRVEKYLDKHLEDMVEREVDSYYYEYY